MNNAHRPGEHRFADALDHLSQAPQGDMPDLSRSIMGRLGYMRVDPAVARRRRMIKWLNRSGVLMVAGAALAIGWRVFDASPEIRRPADTTIPQAISHDVQAQQERFGTMIRTIREISTPHLAPRFGPDMAPKAGGGQEAPAESTRRERRPQPTLAPGSSNPATTADILVPPGQERSVAPDRPQGEQSRAPFGGQILQDDVNRTARLPVRIA